MKLIIALTNKSVKRKKVAIQSTEKMGLFIWISTLGSVDRIIGYHKKRGWINDKCYNTGLSFLGDLWRCIRFKSGSIIICKHL